MSKPTQRSLEQVRCFYLFGVCKCDQNGACDLHTDIARELDAAREEGRQAGLSEARNSPYASGRRDALVAARGLCDALALSYRMKHGGGGDYCVALSDCGDHLTKLIGAQEPK